MFYWHTRVRQWSGRKPLLAIYTLGADNAETAWKLQATFPSRTHRIIRKWSRIIVHTSFFHAAVRVLMDAQCFCRSMQSLITIFPGVRFDVCSLQARCVGIFLHRLCSSTLVRAEAWLAARNSSSGHAHHLHINRVKGNHVKRGKHFEFLRLFDVECLLR